ncbi:MAG TPA: hypothetical protein VEK80_16290 [Kribbellaceae bacterium]|nr:hypothetical protein [Kribbellaceae bacterium]
MINAFSEQRGYRYSMPLAAALSLLLSSCAAPAGQGQTLVRCSVRVDNPHESHGTSGNITGKVTFWCSGRVDSVTGTVKLQRHTGNTWTDVAAPVRRPIENPKRGKRYTVTASTPCDNGTYRTAGKGYGYRDGVKSESTRWEYSRAVKNPCA